MDLKLENVQLLPFHSPTSRLQISSKCKVINILSNVFHDLFTFSCFSPFPRPALDLQATFFASIATKIRDKGL